SEVADGRNNLSNAPQLADRTIDGHGAHALLQLGDVGVDVVNRHIRGSPSCRLEHAAALEKIEEEAITLSKIVARDRLEMAGRTPTLEARPRPAGPVPGIAIGLGPEVQWQRSDLPLRWPEIVRRRGQKNCLIRQG